MPRRGWIFFPQRAQFPCHSQNNLGVPELPGPMLNKGKNNPHHIYKRDYVIVTQLGHFFEIICQLMT
jgi:hypothetical protein